LFPTIETYKTEKEDESLKNNASKCEK